MAHGLGLRMIPLLKRGAPARCLCSFLHGPVALCGQGHPATACLLPRLPRPGGRRANSRFALRQRPTTTPALPSSARGARLTAGNPLINKTAHLAEHPRLKTQAIKQWAKAKTTSHQQGTHSYHFSKRVRGRGCAGALRKPLQAAKSRRW